jgi:hypothetical protein
VEETFASATGSRIDEWAKEDEELARGAEVTTKDRSKCSKLNVDKPALH